MFNHSLKKNALAIHANALERYKETYNDMQNSCSDLYKVRKQSIEEIIDIELIISCIANRPKEFDKKLGEIKEHIEKFRNTEEYAKESYESALKSGVGILSGVAAGGAIATAAPSVAMNIATTFGTAATGRAISTLSGAAAQKAALAWIGRMTGGIATKGIVTGAGMTSGQAFLALAGPIGWGVSAATTAASLASLTNKNKKTSNAAIEESKKIMEEREILREATAKIISLTNETSMLLKKLNEQKLKADLYKNTNYLELDEQTQFFLGTMVKNTLSLAALLNKSIE